MSAEPQLSGDFVSEAAAPVAVVNADPSGGQTQDHNVPLAALQQERAQRQQLQEELRMIKDHLSLLQANQVRQQEQPRDEGEKLSKDDVLTYGDFERLLGQKERQFQMSIEEMRMTQKYSDYQEVITKYLPEVLKNNPSLHRSLQQTQDYELAYHLAKNSDTYRNQSKSVQRNADADRMVKNSQLSGSLSAVGGTSPIDTAKRYKDMSDEEFIKEANKNRGYT